MRKKINLTYKISEKTFFFISKLFITKLLFLVSYLIILIILTLIYNKCFINLLKNLNIILIKFLIILVNKLLLFIFIKYYFNFKLNLIFKKKFIYK